MLYIAPCAKRDPTCFKICSHWKSDKYFYIEKSSMSRS